MSKIRSVQISIAMIVALLFSAVAPGAVFADSGTPPVPEETAPAGTQEDAIEEPPAAETPEVQGEATETAATSETEGEVSGEAETPEAEGEATETAATSEAEGEKSGETETPEVEGEATETAATPETEGEESGVSATPEAEGEATEAVEQTLTATPAETSPAPVEETVLEQLPDDTAIIVLNEEGEAQPLASQESADAIEEGDPIWCPTGQDPTPGENGCTPSFASFDELLSFLAANENEAAYQTAGTIFVETGDYAGPESVIDFNNYNFNTINTFDLTLQGGWDTAAEAAEAVQPDAFTNFTAPFIFGSAANPWIGAITINQFNILGVSNGTALSVVTQSDVNVNNSTFNENENGIMIEAGGDVTLNAVQADNNEQAGAVINAGGNVNVVDSSFSENGTPSEYGAAGQGLAVESGGEVILANVQANNNERFGADITAASSVGITNSIFSGNMGYTGYYCGGKKFSGYGLQVVSLDSVTLENVEASNNNLFGARLEAALDVEITNGRFNDNGVIYGSFIDGRGLEIENGGYAILDDVQANNNNLFGADIHTMESAFITNGQFNGNRAYTCSHCGGKNYYGYGLNVVATDSIYLTEVSASDNNVCGTCLSAGGDVFITDSLFNNNGVQYGSTVKGFGMVVKSGGAVSFYGVEASDNKLHGAYINAIEMVNISSSVFSGNQGYTSSRCGGKKYYGFGLQVISQDGISLYEVSAEDNTLYGASLLAENDISISNSSFSNNRVGNGSTAYGYGLNAQSTGNIYLSEVNASNNYLYGASLNAGGSAALSSSVFSGNKYSYVNHCGCSNYYGFGLQVVAAEAISLFEVEASNNNLFGARLKAGTDVDIFAGEFNNNQTGSHDKPEGYGVSIQSGGNVSIYDIQASGNLQFGADIVAAGLVDVQLGIFNNNKGYGYTRCAKTYYGYGLQVVTLEAITLSDISAEGNYRFGAHLETEDDVSVYNSSFNQNGVNTSSYVNGYGLQIASGGNVTLEGVSASENKLFGAQISADGTVTVTDSEFNRNQAATCTRCSNSYWGFGLMVNAFEMISLNSVTASENFKYGASLYSPADVQVTNSLFNANGVNTCSYVEGYGLYVESGGNVTLEGVQANENKLYGASIESEGSVTVNDSEFNRNRAVTCTRCSSTYYGYGILINALDMILLNGVTANENYRNGARIDADAELIISDSTFNNNGNNRARYDGLFITAAGQVLLTNVEASGNSMNGVSITGSPCTEVIVDGGVFGANDKYGIKVIHGRLTLNGQPVFVDNGSGDYRVYTGNCTP